MRDTGPQNTQYLTLIIFYTEVLSSLKGQSLTTIPFRLDKSCWWDVTQRGFIFCLALYKYLNRRPLPTVRYLSNTCWGMGFLPAPSSEYYDYTSKWIDQIQWLIPLRLFPRRCILRADYKIKTQSKIMMRFILIWVMDFKIWLPLFISDLFKKFLFCFILFFQKVSSKPTSVATEFRDDNCFTIKNKHNEKIGRENSYR